MKLTEITPQEFMCSNCSPCCPAVYDTDQDTYIIVGKKLSDEAFNMIKDRVADDEYVIEVEKGMIDKL